MFGIGELVAADGIFTTQPFELFWINNNIGGVRTTGKFSTAGTMAVLEYKLGSGKLVSNAITQATDFDFFTHSNLQFCTIRA